VRLNVKLFDSRSLNSHAGSFPSLCVFVCGGVGVRRIVGWDAPIQ
jgi:hypothetical protein